MTTKKTIAQNAAPLASDEDDETLARAFVIWLAAFALALLFSVFVISDAQSAGLHVAEKNAVSPILRPAQAMPSGLIAATDAALAPTAIASDFDARPGSTLAVTAAAAPTSAGAASEAARATEPNARINPASSGKDGTGKKPPPSATRLRRRRTPPPMQNSMIKVGPRSAFAPCKSAMSPLVASSPP